MVMIKDKKGIERFSLSTKLNDMIIRIKEKIINEDSMVIGILFGGVGGGKSIRAQHIGYAIDSTLDNLDRVAFNKDDFIQAVLKSKKQVVIGDEGIALFFSRGSMTKEGRLIVELMAQCRQKNLCVLICVPELLSVDWLILNSANFVAYVWEDRKEINGKTVTIKGNMAIYPNLPRHNYKSQIIHYLKSKRRSPHIRIKRPLPYLLEPGNPIGDTFKKVWYPVGEEGYKAKKESILKKYMIEPKKKERNLKIDYELMDSLIEKGFKQKYIADKCNCSIKTIEKRVQTLKNPKKKGDLLRK